MLKDGGAVVTMEISERTIGTGARVAAITSTTERVLRTPTCAGTACAHKPTTHLAKYPALSLPQYTLASQIALYFL